MSRPISYLQIAAIAALAGGCGSVATPAADSAATSLAGWYTQDATHATVQPCAASDRLAVTNGTELRDRAARFGLQDGDPVYVRVEGTRTDGGFRLQRVEQFGSPTPVRDCPMTGTSIQQ